MRRMCGARMPLAIRRDRAADDTGMNIKRGWTSHSRHKAAGSARVCAVAAALVLMPALAAAQDMVQPAPAPAVEKPGFFGAIGQWFERQTGEINATFKDAGRRFDNLGHEAGVVARTTVDGAKDAAGVVARLPNARVVSGHEKCLTASNGAPDCLAAADAVCKTKGFGSGKSVDMTTAEVCPPKVWMSGRTTGAGCHTETFVSRALCQ